MTKEIRRVSWFNENKGFGFIISTKDDKFVFTSDQHLAMRAPKDAVKVPSDYFTSLGAKMVKEIASGTAELSGDGTTTATTLGIPIKR